MLTLHVDGEVELRVLEDRDADELFRLTEQNRLYLRRWLPWVDANVSAEETRSFIQRGLRQLAEGNGFQAGVWYRGRLVGAIGLHYVDRTNRRTEIGYWLDSAHQGLGIMTRACRAVVTYAFDTLGLHRVEIRCAAGNRRSRAVAERLGLVEEGTLRQCAWIDGRFEDMVVYGALAPEWKARQSEEAAADASR